MLSGQVRAPNNDDWKKLRRLLNYLKCTMSNHMVVNINRGFQAAKWYMSASSAVHPDFKSHSGGCLLLSDSGGAPISGSTKQKLNTRSSKVAKVVGVDDFIGKVIWFQHFMEMQGFAL